LTNFDPRDSEWIKAAGIATKKHPEDRRTWDVASVALQLSMLGAEHTSIWVRSRSKNQ
jgi:hypothetical protein